MTNTLYYGDNLDILRQHVPDESVDLVYLDPPFNSNANYNVLFKEQSGEASPAQIRAFTDTWEWTQEAERTLRAGDHHQPRHACQRQGDGLRVPPVHRQQRHDGVPRHDDAPPRRAASRAEAHRLHLPPLRPDGQPLPQAADGHDLRSGEFPHRDNLEADERP